MTDTVLYVTAPNAGPSADTTWSEGVLELERQLERVAPRSSVECVDSIEALDERVAAADCVVFAEDATGDAPPIEAVAAACSGTPLIYYGNPDRVSAADPDNGPDTDPTHDLTADSRVDSTSIHALEGVDGFVRRTDDSVVHLADEIDWQCRRQSGQSTATATVDESGDRPKVARLHRMTTRLVACRSEERLLDLAIESAEAILGFDASSISLAEERDGETKLVIRAGSDEFDDISRAHDLSEGILGKTYREQRSFLLEEVADHPDARPHEDGYGSAISVPIEEFGVFQAISTDERAYDESDLEFAELLVTYVAQTLSRLRVAETLRERRERLTRLHEGTTKIVGSTDEAAVYERALETTETVLELDICVFLSADLETEELVPEAYSDTMDERLARRVPLDHGIVGETYQRGEPSVIDEVMIEDPEIEGLERFKSAMTVPLGEYGVFQAVSEQSHAFDDIDLELAELLCAHVTEAIGRARAEASLVEERDRLSALFDNVPDPAVQYHLSDGEPTVQAVNDRFEEVFGFDTDTVLHEDVDDYIIPSGYEDEARRLNEALFAGETLRVVTRRRTATDVRDFLVNVVPLTAGERSVEGYAIYTDITDQKRHERALTAKNERLDEFASIVSHDLRNPLNVAQGYLELLGETGDQSHLEEIDNALDRMDELIERLLTLSRRGDVIDDTEPLEVHAVATKAWSAVDTDGATLQLGENQSLEADRARLREALENLFRNSVEHGSSESSGERNGDASDLTITVGALEDGFFVADDGVGIPSDARQSVFETGYTTASGGTGFGLNIVDQIARAHGWIVEITDSDAGGARFEFREGSPEDEEHGSDGGSVADSADPAVDHRHRRPRSDLESPAEGSDPSP
ncbi:GAF domain-containing protein [Saliphagus sp. GCM10025334]